MTNDQRQAVRTGWWGVVLALVVIACAAAVVGCGGDASSGGVGTSSSTRNSTESSGPSAEFAGNGPNGELATAGKESSVKEREAASRVLEKSFKARAAKNWALQCKTLTRSLIREIESSVAGGIFTLKCSEGLEAGAQKASSNAVFENTMVEPLAALRINGKKAFAFYHGAKGKDYVMPMEKEGGKWKVAALAPQETP